MLEIWASSKEAKTGTLFSPTWHTSYISNHLDLPLILNTHSRSWISGSWRSWVHGLQQPSVHFCSFQTQHSPVILLHVWITRSCPSWNRYGIQDWHFLPWSCNPLYTILALCGFSLLVHIKTDAHSKRYMRHRGFQLVLSLRNLINLLIYPRSVESLVLEYTMNHSVLLYYSK